MTNGAEEVFDQSIAALIHVHAVVGCETIDALVDGDLPADEQPHVAFKLLESASQLYRLTGDEAVVETLAQLPHDCPRALLIAGAHFVDTSASVEELRELAACDDLDEDDIFSIEIALLYRDKWGLAYFLAYRLAGKFWAAGFDPELCQALAHFQHQLDELDQAFAQMPEAVRSSMDILAGLRAATKVTLPEEA